MGQGGEGCRRAGGLVVPVPSFWTSRQGRDPESMLTLNSLKMDSGLRQNDVRGWFVVLPAPSFWTSRQGRDPESMLTLNSLKMDSGLRQNDVTGYRNIQ
jgi:hypothetical protein